MASRIIALCVFGILGGSSVALEDTPSSRLQHLKMILNGLGFNELPEKRGYTYVSEYKRLPLYNFGIGKRWPDNNDEKRSRSYDFGIGKRGKNFDFGLGKRSEELDYYPVRQSSFDYLPDDAFNDIYEEKRGRYDFGLGKRAWSLGSGNPESFGVGKRPKEGAARDFRFGLGKRMAEDEDATQ